MFKKLIDFLLKNKEIFPNGIGTTELPKNIFDGKQKTKSSDFKKYVNSYFKPQINELGFKGKDYIYYRENENYTEIITFWTYKVGGAIAVDLSVKFNNINYPDNTNESKEENYEEAEFHKRLSPNNNLNKHKQNIWWWIFEEEEKDNIKLIEDIKRTFIKRGIEFFEQFENHNEYIKKIDAKNYVNFPDFNITIYLKRKEYKILFFLMYYNLNINEKVKAKQFAIKGKKSLENENYGKEYLIEGEFN